MNSMLFPLIGLCLAVSFFMSGMESGVLALSRVRIRRLVRAGSSNARRLNRYLEQPEEFLWTILTGNTLSNFGAASLVVIGAKDWIRDHPWLFVLAFAVGTVLFYALCELLPKMLFRLYPNRLSLLLSGPFAVVHVALRPLVTLLRWLAAGLLRWTGGRTFVGELFGTREEMRVLMQESSHDLSAEERGMINRVLDLQNLTVSHVVVPMSRAASVTTEMRLADALALCRERSLSRLPVWRDGKPRRIVGLFNAKALLYRPDADVTRKVGDCIHPATFLDADMRLDEALRHMQRAGQRLVIVLARDGSEVGIVSLQDLLKAIFGEVRL